MDFFNKLGKKASETYQVTKEKATNLSEELKIKGKISELKDKIEDKYREIGKRVYNEMKYGKDVSRDTVISICEDISRKKDEISKFEIQLLAIKKVKKCAGCGTELELTDEFCSKCGKQQPKIEKVEIKKEEPQNTKEAEVIEINNVENNHIEENNNNYDSNNFYG